MPYDVANALICRIDNHIRKYGLDSFTILFHGGEPLLFGKRRFTALVYDIMEISYKHGCHFNLLMTTNGLLLDEEWIDIILAFKISLTISLDGPKLIHDGRRIRKNGAGTHSDVMNAIKILRSRKVSFGVLAVCDPSSNPEEIYAFFKEHDIAHYDVLVPDATHDDINVPQIDRYYIELFDIWFSERENRSQIRILDALVRGTLGVRTGIESVGFGAVDKCIINVNGGLEPLDVLRIAGYESTKTSMNILANELQELTTDSVWLAAYEASLNLHEDCKICKFKISCGGGYLPHRWSSGRGYNNPNVYCKDLKNILSHVEAEVWNHLKLR